MDFNKNYEKEMAAAWLDRFETEKSANYEQLKKELGINSRRHNVVLQWARVTAIAAAIAIAAVGGALLQRRSDSNLTAESITEISVPDGSRMKVTLPEGTEVWLAGGSTLSYDGAFRERKVSLDGEGFFKVTHDEANPFTVNAANMDITVLGTVFDVRSYSDERSSRVDLIDGCVNVTGKTSGLSKTLKPDQRAVVDSETGIVTVEATDASRSALWISGKLRFTDATMDELLTDIERFKGVSFERNGELLSGERFSGSISLDQSVDAILRNIDLDNKLTWKQVGESIEITQK